MAVAPLRLQTDNITWKRVEDSIVLFDLTNSTYLSVNGSGAVIWDLLRSGTNIEALVKSVTEHFDVDDKTARSDIELFLIELRKRKLLNESLNG